MASIVEKIVPDWSWGPGSSPATGAVITAAHTLAGATVAGAIGAPWYAVAMGGGLISMAAAANAAYSEQPARVIGYRAGTWLAGTLWATPSVAMYNAGADHVWGNGPWSPPGWAVLAGGTLVAAAVGKWLSWKERREQEAALAKTEIPLAYADDEEGIAAEWQARLRQVTRRAVIVRNVEYWETGYGYTLDCDLPVDGTTVADIKAYEMALMASFRSGIGCNVEVLESEIGRGSFLVRVATRDALADDQVMSTDLPQTRIADPISLGVHTDGTEESMVINYSTTAMIGQKDSGKSNTLNVVTKGIAQTIDAVIFAIDKTGNGRFPRPWVRAWKEERAPRPIIDWVAPTDEEARIMCKSILGMINRTAAYADRMAAENSDKIAPAPDLPAIIVLVDEWGSLPEDVRDMLVQISDTGRGAGVSVVGCALRATGKYFNRDFIAQSRNRIAMRCQDEAEAQALFDSTWSRGRFDMSMLPYAGCGLVGTGATKPAQTKMWRFDPNRIDEVSIALAPRRPSLDKATADLGQVVEIEVKGMDPIVLQDAYSARWKRVLPIMFPVSRTGQAPVATPAPRSTTPTAVMERKAPVMNLEESQAEIRRALEAARAAAAAADAEYAAEQAGVDTDAQEEIALLNELFNSPAATDPMAQPTGGNTSTVGARERMMQLLKEAGSQGTGASALTRLLRAEGYPTARQTAMDWLKEELAKGTIIQPEGPGRPYVHGEVES